MVYRRRPEINWHGMAVQTPRILASIGFTLQRQYYVGKAGMAFRRGPPHCHSGHMRGTLFGENGEAGRCALRPV